MSDDDATIEVVDVPEKSRFEIREQGWEVVRDSKGQVLKDRHGKPETEMTLGGQAYWFYLKDFAGAPKD